MECLNFLVDQMVIATIMSKECKVRATVISVLRTGQNAKEIANFNNILFLIVYNLKKPYHVDPGTTTPASKNV